MDSDRGAGRFYSPLDHWTQGGQALSGIGATTDYEWAASKRLLLTHGRLLDTQAVRDAFRGTASYVHPTDILYPQLFQQPLVDEDPVGYAERLNNLAPRVAPWLQDIGKVGRIALSPDLRQPMYNTLVHNALADEVTIEGQVGPVPVANPRVFAPVPAHIRQFREP
jgi:hypothetical protein